MSVTYTPLERPGGLAGKPLYTPEEAIEAHQSAVVGIESNLRFPNVCFWEKVDVRVDLLESAAETR